MQKIKVWDVMEEDYMNNDELWRLFEETGDIEHYIIYKLSKNRFFDKRGSRSADFAKEIFSGNEFPKTL